MLMYQSYDGWKEYSNQLFCSHFFPTSRTLSRTFVLARYCHLYTSLPEDVTAFGWYLLSKRAWNFCIYFLRHDLVLDQNKVVFLNKKKCWIWGRVGLCFVSSRDYRWTFFCKQCIKTQPRRITILRPPIHDRPNPSILWALYWDKKKYIFFLYCSYISVNLKAS